MEAIKMSLSCDKEEKSAYVDPRSCHEKIFKSANQMGLANYCNPVNNYVETAIAYLQKYLTDKSSDHLLRAALFYIGEECQKTLR